MLIEQNNDGMRTEAQNAFIDIGATDTDKNKKDNLDFSPSNPDLWPTVEVMNINDTARGLSNQELSYFKSMIQAKVDEAKSLAHISANIDKYTQEHPPVSEVEKQVIAEKVIDVAKRAQAKNPEALKSPFALLSLLIPKLPRKVYEIFTGITVLSLLFSACTSSASSPIEANNVPEKPTMSAGLPEGFPTETPGSGIDNEFDTALVQNLEASQIYNTFYVKSLEENEGPISQDLIAFKNDIGLEGKKIINEEYGDFDINAYGFLYFKAGDGSQVVFNIKDESGNYLIATREEGFNRYAQINPEATAGKTAEDFILVADAADGALADLVEQKTGLKTGMIVDKNTNQWNPLGQSDPVAGETVTPTADVENAEDDSGLLTSDPEVIASLVEKYVSGDIEYPDDLTAEQKSTFQKILSQVEASLPYEQQKAHVEDRFEQGSKSWDALVNAEGNLDYYDGTWHTIEKMVTPEGYVIPWGEMYYTDNQEGMDGLSKIFGSQELTNQWQTYLTEQGAEVEEAGAGNAEKLDVLFIQTVPDNGSRQVEMVGPKLSRIGLNFLLIIKIDNQIKVINKEIDGSNRLITLKLYDGSYQSYSWSAEIGEEGEKQLAPGLVGISSEVMVRYGFLAQIETYDTAYTATEQNWINQNLAGNAEKVLEDPIKQIQELTLNSEHYIELSKLPSE